MAGKQSSFVWYELMSSDVAAAKALFATSRTYWERVEPVAESFGDIDPKIDGREDDERDPAGKGDDLV